jgi:hypothetical protein
LEVCGSPEIDVQLLKQNTKYTGCNANDPHIKYFWQVLEAFSQTERAQFLRFAWGRSRLPPASKFTEKMKIDSSNITVAHLPRAHTCVRSRVGCCVCALVCGDDDGELTVCSCLCLVWGCCSFGVCWLSTVLQVSAPRSPASHVASRLRC